MSYILAKPNQDPIYPVIEADIRGAYPNVLFPSNLNLNNLSNFFVYPVTQLPIPEYNPLTQKLSQKPPQLVEGEWVVDWEILELTPEEIEASKPRPDFIGFQLAALSTPEFKAMIVDAYPTEPLACASLASLLSQVAMGGPTEPLVLAVGQVIQAANPPAEHIQQFIQAAQFYHLPEPLIDVLLRVHLPE